MKILAQGLENPVIKEPLRGKGGTEFLNQALPFFFTWLIIVGFLMFVIYFILGGLKWIQSQGEKAKIEEAQKQITYALIGLLVSFSIFAIVKIIGFVFGIQNLEGLKINFPTL